VHQFDFIAAVKEMKFIENNLIFEYYEGNVIYVLKSNFFNT